jgi:CheY-like chemotaxis protein
MMVNRRILAVDDDILIQMLYQRIFSSKAKPEQQNEALNSLLSIGGKGVATAAPGFELDGFSQGLEAVAAVERSLQQKRPYAVALIDMRMPPGIDGLETAKRIRAMDSAIPIIFVSAYSDHTLDEVMRQVKGPVQWHSKPIDRAQLLQVVKQVCEGDGLTRVTD